jgi:hypothetical protein
MLRHVSIVQPVALALCVTLLTACPPPKNSPVRNRLQQTRYERIVLGFVKQPQSVVFLELRDGALPALQMIRLDTPESSNPVPIDTTIAESVDDSAATRAQVVETVRASSTGARLEAFGMQWARTVDPPLATGMGTVDRLGDKVQARADGATVIDLAALGSAVLPESDVWTTSDDGSLFALEMIYPGQPRVRDMRVFQRDNVDVRLALVRAEQAMQRGADGEAGSRLDWAAGLVAAGDENASAIAYARARLAARRHDVEGTVAQLRDAIAHERRYRGLAQYEADFNPVRHETKFIEFWAVTPDR